MTERVQAVCPVDWCPKCGANMGALSNVTFGVVVWTDKDGDPYDGPSYLEWRCTRCKAPIRTDALDVDDAYYGPPKRAEVRTYP